MSRKYDARSKLEDRLGPDVLARLQSMAHEFGTLLFQFSMLELFYFTIARVAPNGMTDFVHLRSFSICAVWYVVYLRRCSYSVILIIMNIHSSV